MVRIEKGFKRGKFDTVGVYDCMNSAEMAYEKELKKLEPNQILIIEEWTGNVWADRKCNSNS